MTERAGMIGIGIEMPLALLQQADAWAAAQTPAATRAEAIRRLIELGLAAVSAGDQPAEQGTRRAAGMAGAVIDALGDPSATQADRAQRKTRLLKGPEEFRAMRAGARAAKGAK